MFKDFRAFINRGNVLDLSTAVIIGTAFTAIVNSLVKDILMPLIGILLNGMDFSGLSVKVGEAELTYGNFIQAVINFLIISVLVFLFIKLITRLERPFEKKKEAPQPAPPSAEEQLLGEIRDLLKQNINQQRE